jgi:hypothetical protein
MIIEEREYLQYALVTVGFRVYNPERLSVICNYYCVSANVQLLIQT